MNTSTFYITYEELKHDMLEIYQKLSKAFYITYEELKHMAGSTYHVAWNLPFYITYEELKRKK